MRCKIRRMFWRTEEVENGLMYKPRLGDFWNDIVQEYFDDNLANDEAFRLWIVVFWR